MNLHLTGKTAPENLSLINHAPAELTYCIQLYQASRLTIESISEDGRLRLKIDSRRTVELDPRKHPHLDHGYAMTSHSSQGQTADRVLIHVDTELGAKDLLNNRMAYVSVSRGRYDAQIYTNNAATLEQKFSRDVSHSPAIQQETVAHKIEPQTTHTNEIAQGFGLGL